MLQAYLGIMSRRGLELLCPEHPHTKRFLLRRVRREPTRLAGLWSVIPSDHVDDILQALANADCRHALNLLQQHARDSGILLPENADSVDESARGAEADPRPM